ncbi:MAG: 50S ribosomal protein L10 [Brevinematia bacterium]
MPSERNLVLYNEIKELYNKYGKNIIFIDFTGMNVENVNNLRREIRKRNAFYKVVKNTIGYRFFKEDVGLDIPKEVFTGVNGIIFTDDNEFTELLKFLVKLEKDNPLKVKNSIFEGKLYGREATIELSKLPSKKELIGYVVGAISGSVSSFVYTINNVVQSFVFVLKGIEEKKQN